GAESAAGPDGAPGGSSQCVAVVRAGVSHCQTRHLGVDEMKETALTALTVIAIAPSLATAQTSLSIYRDGRVVVRQTMSQALAKGRNTLTLRLAGLDPATLFSPDSAVTVLSARVRYPSTAADALARAAGH